MSYKVYLDRDQGFHVLDEIVIGRWKATPRKFPFDQRDAVIPQTIIPGFMRRGNDLEALYLFYFYICLYMRGGIESLQAFNGMLAMRRDYPKLFDPFWAQNRFIEEVQPIIAKYIGWDSEAVARFWIANSKRLVVYWDGRASLLFSGLTSYDEALRRLKNKLTKKEIREANCNDNHGHGFMGFQEKMVSMYLYFIDWEGLLETPFIYPTPADFHNFRLALAHRIMKLDPEPAHVRATEKISKPWRDFTVEYLEARKGVVTPVELADAIWLFSLVACGNSPLTDFHEQKDKNGHGMFDMHSLRHEAPNFLSPKYRERLKRTCLSCPLIDSCELAIPAGPYYQRRGRRETAFGGQLYLQERFLIERHLRAFPVDYMLRTDKPSKPVIKPLFTEKALKQPKP